MKSNKLVMAAAALVLPTQAAFAQDIAINAQLGISDIDYVDNTGVALILSAEMAVAPNFYVEGEFTTSVVDPSWNYTYLCGTTGFPSFQPVYCSVDVDISYNTFGGYAKYVMPVNGNFDVYGRAGLVNISGLHASSFELGLGGGINYMFNQNMGLTAGVTLIDDLTHISAGLRYEL